MDRVAAMESFVRTVEQGSFAAAAAGRGLSATMVGNHVRFLEARLGTLLLNRTTRRQGVTEFGRSYYERCRVILAEIEAAETAAEAVQAVPRGLLRVTAPVALGTTVLPSLLASYLGRHPEVRVDLVLQDHRLDLVADELDVAIRAGALPDSSLVARALPPLQLVVCAAPAYLAAHGTPVSPAELTAHNCLDFAHATEPLLWRFEGEGDNAALVHLVDGGRADPSPGPLCDDPVATDGLRASCQQHPVQDGHADGSLGLLGSKAAGSQPWSDQRLVAAHCCFY